MNLIVTMYLLKVFELDGLQNGPLEHCTVPAGEDWLKYAGPIIEARMGQYAQGEIHFNLMAVIKDRRMTAQKRIEALRAEVQQGKKTQDQVSQGTGRRWNTSRRCIHWR